MDKDKVAPDTNFESNIERLATDSKALLSRMPYDNLKVKRNLDQLYHLLKRKNEESKAIPEEYKARDTYRLTQLGIECSVISQTLINEQYLMNKRREEKEAKKANQFVTTLGSEYDIMGYLAKYRDFMLFNLTDHAYIDGKNRVQKKVAKKVTKLWADDLKKIISEFETGPYTNPFLGNRLTTHVNRLPFKKKSQEITGKKIEYFNSLQKYIRFKYLEKERIHINMSNIISEFASFTQTTPEICELWKILGHHTVTYERLVATKLGSSNEILNEINYDPKSIVQMSYDDLIRASCRILEEEFLELIFTSNRTLSSNLHLSNRDEDYNFIRREYLDSDFSKRNYIERDNHDVPVWAFCYVYFRSGRLDKLKDFIVTYKGNLDGDLKEYDNFLYTYYQNQGYLPSHLTRSILESLNTGTQEVDVFKQMLYFILAKHEEVPSEDLISRLGDYLWFNLKVCVSLEDYSPVEDESGPKVLNNALSLYEIQNTIISYGPEHFNPGNRTPLNYVKTLFIVMAYDEALTFLRNYDVYFEEMVHFAIALKESNLMSLRHRYQEVDKKAKFNFFTDKDYENAIIDYSLGFCARNPIESSYYLKLLYPAPSKNLRDIEKRKLVVETISNFIVTNDQIAFFFDNSTNADHLKAIFGQDVFREIILNIAERYKGNNLKVALKLLEKIEFHEKVLELILKEEYENLRRYQDRVQDSYVYIPKFQYEELFNEILDKYTLRKIVERYPHLFHANKFVRQVKQLWILYAKKDYTNAFDYLKNWDAKELVFGNEERRMLEDLKNKHPIVQECYLDLLFIACKILKEFTEHLKSAQKDHMYVNTKMAEVKRCWIRIGKFYGVIRRHYTDKNYLQMLKKLDTEIDLQV